MLKQVVAVAFILGAVIFARPIGATALLPGAHADFQYYTFALTWQPGICNTEDGCLADQPKTPLIGLHGLWASLPQTLIDAGVTPQQWWQRGCDYFEHSDAPPVLDTTLEQQIDAVMPHFAHSLLTHEYDKHVQCFKFDPNLFFSTELTMRDAIANSAFGQYLQSHAGSDVAHADLTHAFNAAFSTSATTSLALECGQTAAGTTVLTQLWISIEASQLGAFPQPAALINAPIAQDNCPATFRVPAWTS